MIEESRFPAAPRRPVPRFDRIEAGKKRAAPRAGERLAPNERRII